MNFEKENGVALPIVHSGSLMMAERPDFAEVLARQVECSRQWGVEVESIDAREALIRTPLLENIDARTIFHTPSDVYIEEPSTLLHAYIEAGERLGMQTIANTPVTGIRTRNGEVEAVVTDHGEIRTSIVVDAAGAWARQIASSGGAKFPLTCVRHQLYITEPIADMEPEYPIVRFIDSAVYIRAARGGLMFGGFEPGPLVFDAVTQRADFSIADLPLDLAPLDSMTSAIVEKMPSLKVPEIAEHRGGLFTMTPDGRFIVGPAPDVRGLWMATGCNGGGFSFSPALGQLLAEWIIEGEPSPDISDFHPGRFSESFLSEKQLQESAVWHYANYFDRKHTSVGEAH